MSTENKNEELKSYADGWIMEQKEPGIPGFLKLAYPVIILALLAYVFLYMNGEVNHSTRGALVQQLNAVTGAADAFMYVVAAMMAVFGVILIGFVFSKKEH